MSLFKRGILHRAATGSGTGTGILGEVNTFSDLPASATIGNRYLVLSYSISTPTKLKGVYRWNGSSWDRQNGARAFDVVYDNSGSTLTSVNLEASTNELDAKVNGKEPTITSTSTSDYYRGDKTFQPLNKTAVGLANVDNTSDLNKPISNATQTVLDGKEPSFTKNTAFNKNFGTVSGTVTEGNDSRFTNHLNSFTQNSGQNIATEEIRARDANGLKLYDDGGDGIFIKDGGNVGIGTSSPSAKLHLNGNASIKYDVDIDGKFNVTNKTINSNGYGVNDAIARIMHDTQNSLYAEYGLNMGVAISSGNTWMQTARMNSIDPARNGNQFNLLIQPSAGNVGIGTISPSAKLHVVGNATVSGSLSKGSGSFDIPHPDPNKKDTHRLRHYFVETPSAGGNIYKYQIECKEGENYIDLPDYFQFLNKDSLVWVNAFKHFGRAWGEVIEDKQVKIIAELTGIYNILIFADRKDEIAMKEFNKYGIEYKIKK